MTTAKFKIKIAKIMGEGKGRGGCEAVAPTIRNQTDRGYYPPPRIYKGKK